MESHKKEGGVHKKLGYYIDKKECKPDSQDVCLYFGAGRESSVLTCKCIKHFVFVDGKPFLLEDGTPNPVYHPPGRIVSYETFIKEVERNFPIEFESREISKKGKGKLVKYVFPDKRTLNYYMNTTVQDFIDSEYGIREMKFITLIDLQGFHPFKYGFL